MTTAIASELHNTRLRVGATGESIRTNTKPPMYTASPPVRPVMSAVAHWR